MAPISTLWRTFPGTASAGQPVLHGHRPEGDEQGDDAAYFLSQALRTGETVRRYLLLFQWSNPSPKDHLALFTHGVVSQ